jgi:hypothetical protein
MLLAETSIEDLGDIFRMGICPSYESGSIRDEICKWAIAEKVFFAYAFHIQLPPAYRSHLARPFSPYRRSGLIEDVLISHSRLLLL